jgi:hypothetical protein
VRAEQDKGRRRAATIAMFVAVAGLVLLQLHWVPIKILGGILLVAGGLTEAVLSINIFVRRFRRRLS